MADREKVMTWLEICGKNNDCSGSCPYSGEYGQCRESLMADAYALLKEQQEQIDKLLEESASNAEFAEGLKELLKEQPEIVRCKDCKYGEPMCKPWEDIVCTQNRATHCPDWFCADGERR